MNSAIETVSAPEAASTSGGPSAVSSAIASATVEDEITITGRKPYIRRDGHVGPISQLKLRPLEEREWAASLATTLSGADAIIEIKNRLGIDLKWETAYKRFIHWQQQQDRLEDYAESLQQRHDFAETAGPATSEANRDANAALLMDEAARKSDGDTFAKLARISLSESRLTLNARKVDLLRKRIDLDRKWLAWAIKKERGAVVAARPPEKPKMTADERQARIRQILGVD
jgi:hypothetical protein